MRLCIRRCRNDPLVEELDFILRSGGIISVDEERHQSTVLAIVRCNGEEEAQSIVVVVTGVRQAPACLTVMLHEQVCFVAILQNCDVGNPC